MNLPKCKYFFTPVISGIIKLTLFVAARNFMSKCPIIWRELGKSHGDIASSPCVTPGIYSSSFTFTILLETHIFLPHWLYFLLQDITPMPPNLHLTAPPQLIPLSLGPNSSFPAPNPETSMGSVACCPSKDIFNGQGFNVQGTCPSVLAIQLSPW